MARLRTLAEWEALKGEVALTEPERYLIECCREGRPCRLGDGSRPEGPHPDRNIRAELLRYLILGGCEKCKLDEWGVRLMGAFVKGRLDVSFARATGGTALVRCRFDNPVQALESRFQFLNLSGSWLPGLNAQGTNVSSSVRLSNGFVAMGKVSLSGAKIGGQLACVRSTFENDGADALNAQGIEVAGSVFFRDGFVSRGLVRLSSAKIGGQFACREGTFSNSRGDALNAARMHVTGQFFWRDNTVESGRVILAAAHVGDLVDKMNSWPDGGRLILDGFSYDRIGDAPTDAKTRLKWLRKGDRWGGEFFPQPYNQLAKVLREMGHDRAARAVRIKQEQLVRQHIRDTSRIVPNGNVGVAFKSLWADGRNLIRWVWDTVLRGITGYGHAPVRSVIALGVLFLIATFLSNRAWNEGSFAPNSGPILVSSGWTDLADDTSIQNPAEAWSADNAPGQDWETFNRYAYGFDVVVPILTLGQTEAWAPSTTREWWGRQLWWARWVLSSLGWIVTALGAAAITGIIRRD